MGRGFDLPVEITSESGHPQRERKKTLSLTDEFPEMLLPMLPKSTASSLGPW